MAGLTTEGFSTKTLTDLKSEIEAALRAKIRNNLNLKASSRFGILTGIVAERFAELWDLALAVYQARTPDGAQGAALDDVCAITGTIRDPGSKSSGLLTLTGDEGTVVPAGSVVSADGSGARFVTLEDSEPLLIGDDWSALGDTELLTAGEYYWSTVSGTTRIYLVTTTGTTGVWAALSSESRAITLGTAVVAFLGLGNSQWQVDAEAEEIGPNAAVAYSLNTIETPESGWQGSTNLLDFDLGTLLEDDATLRLRREAELRQAGNSSLAAIRTNVLGIKVSEGFGQTVQTCTVFENATNQTVGSLPPHSIEVVVRGGLDADIATAIFNSKAGGIDTYGTSTYEVVDSEGTEHTINFSRITETEMYVSAEVEIDPVNFPLDGEAQIKAAIVAWGDALKAGRNVVPFELGAQFFKVVGVIDVADLEFGDVGDQTNVAAWPIGLREIAVFDSSRITLTFVDGVP